MRLELLAREVSVGVVFDDELDNVVSRSTECDVVGHAPGHSGVQKGDHLPLRVENTGARVAFGREVAKPLVEVEDSDLPGILLELIARVSFQLGEATESEVGFLTVLGNNEARIALIVPEARSREACSVDTVQKPVKMIGRVLEGGQIGDVGVEECSDLVGRKFPC